jgi:hypothetical protein
MGNNKTQWDLGEHGSTCIGKRPNNNIKDFVPLAPHALQLLSACTCIAQKRGKQFNNLPLPY